MSSVYIIDGSGYIFRAYYAIQQSLTTSSGLPTNALYGFTKMLLGFIERVSKDVEESPVVYVVFDAGRKNFRHDLYPEYKANRAACPEDLVPQMPYFPKIAEALGFHVLQKEGYEADDVIATIIKKYEAIKTPGLTIVSADKDLTQLVNDSVTMWDPMRDRLFNEEEVLKHFGVKPSQMRDYLSIVGDTSDNVPGVKGVGPKTVAQLFHIFSSLDDLLHNLNRVSELKDLRGAKSVQTKLESNLDNIRLSYQLVSLDENVSLELNNTKWAGFREELLKSLVSELEFESLFNKFSIAPKKQKSDSSHKRYSLITVDELARLLESNTSIKKIGIDTETDSVNPHTAKVVGVSISWEADVGFYVQVDEQSRDSLCEILRSLGLNRDIIKYGSNIKYDMSVLRDLSVEFSSPLFDTVIASHLLYPEGRSHGLKSLAKKFLDEDMVTYEEMMSGSSHINEVPIEQLAQYAAHDADASLQVGLKLEEQFSLPGNEKLRHLFENIEMPLIPVLTSMEDKGIKIDLEKLNSLEKEFAEEIENLAHNIVTHAEEDFNVNSPKQLSAILFEKLGLNTFGIKKNQNGYSTDSQSLMALKGSHPIIDDIIEYREVYKLQTTYVQALKNLINEKTGRIHTTFNQAITATGRLSSSDPNLQNIPIRSERGKRIRELFISDINCSFVIADYSQIELRVLAHLSEDANLITAFQSGEDIHLRTARELFGDMFALGNTASHYRRIAKTINFGIIYGMGAFRLSKDLGVSRAEAQSFIDAYFSRYPKVKTYFDGVEKSVEKQGYIETLFGRRRSLEEVSAKGRDKGYSVRSLMNMPIQGTAAELVKLSMIALHEKLVAEGGDLLLQVHDEVICEVPDQMAPYWSEIVKNTMENVCKLLVPLKADVITAKTWGAKS